MVAPNKGEELILLYKVIIDDIRFSKKQQWSTIYLTLLAIGAILALSFSLDSKQMLSQRFLPDFFFGNSIDISFRDFLAGICFGISLLGILYIVLYQGDIYRYRTIKGLLIKNFTKKAQIITKKEPKWYNFFHFVLFVILFSAMIFLAGVLGLSIVTKMN